MSVDMEQEEPEERKPFDAVQFIKFSIVGLSNTIVSYVAYVIILFILQAFDLIPDVDYLVSQWVSYTLSILWAFYWNRRKVFLSDAVPWHIALIRSFIAYSFSGLLLSSVLLYVEVDVFGMSKIIAPIINIAICVPINYLINKHWAFKS